MLKRIKNIYKAIIWAVIVLILSNLSSDSLNSLPKLNIPHFDKAVHFIMYFILCILLISGFKQMKNSFASTNAILISVIFSIVYGGLMEIMQEFISTGRSVDLFDFIANLAGTIVAVGFYPLLRKKSWVY